MVIGVLRFRVLIHDATSLKDKRRVVRSLKERLHRDCTVAVAEVGSHDLLNCATLGLACVAADGRRVGEVLDGVCNRLREMRDGEVVDIRRHLLHDLGDDDAVDDDAAEADESALAREMLAHFDAPADTDDGDRP